MVPQLYVRKLSYHNTSIVLHLPHQWTKEAKISKKDSLFVITDGSFAILTKAITSKKGLTGESVELIERFISELSKNNHR